MQPQSTEDLQTWLQVAFPASRFPSQESEPEPPTSEICGPPPSQPYAQLDHATASLRTFQASLLLDTSSESYATLPKAGIACDGVVYRQPKWERRISEIGSGLLPTPAAQEPGWTINGTVEVVDKNGAPPTHPNQRFYDKTTGRLVQKGLTQVTQMFPTPVVPNGGRQHNLDNIELDGNTLYWRDGSKAQMDLETFVRMWPTPRQFMHKDTHTDRGKSNLGEVVGGKLNPTWTEWLMGWPLEWTDLKPLAMDKYLSWLQQHGVCSAKD